jgi:hypothetical protein
MAKFDSVTIPATGSVPVASGYRGANQVSLVAHPSNTGIIYVKTTGDTGNGYPLSAGATLNIGASNLAAMTASGVVGGRLHYAYSD